MDFGNYGGSGSVVYKFEKAPWKWRIKRATFREELEHDKLFVGYTVVTNPDGTRQQEITMTDAGVAREEIWLTFDGTNIPATRSVNPEDIVDIDSVGPRTQGLYIPYSAGKNKEQFLELLAQMPAEMVDELWGAVRRANPHWMPPLARALMEAQSTSEEYLDSDQESGEIDTEESSEQE